MEKNHDYAQQYKNRQSYIRVGILVSVWVTNWEHSHLGQIFLKTVTAHNGHFNMLYAIQMGIADRWSRSSHGYRILKKNNGS